MVFPVVTEETLIAIPEAVCPIRLTALPSRVDDGRLEHIQHTPAGVPESPAEIDLLEIHEEPFVEQSDRVECTAAQQQARAADLIDFAGSLHRPSGETI